jgi:hypothetical protein
LNSRPPVSGIGETEVSQSEVSESIARNVIDKDENEGEATEKINASIALPMLCLARHGPALLARMDACSAAQAIAVS